MAKLTLYVIIITLSLYIWVNCEGYTTIGHINVVEFQNPHHFNCSVTNNMAGDHFDKGALTDFYLKYGSAVNNGANGECVHQSRKGNSTYEDKLAQTCGVNMVFMYSDDSNFGCYTCCEGSWYDYDVTKSCLKCSSRFTTSGPGLHLSCSVKIEPLSTVATSVTPTTPATPSTTPTTSTTQTTLSTTSSTSTTTTVVFPPTLTTTTSTSSSAKSSTTQQTTPGAAEPIQIVEQPTNIGIPILLVLVILANIVAHCWWKHRCEGRNMVCRDNRFNL